MPYRNLTLLLLIVLSCVNSYAATSSSAYISLEGRHFFENGQWDNQNKNNGLSLFTELDWVRVKQNNNVDQEIHFTPFIRYDSIDDERSHADIREAYWLSKHNSWEWLIGVNRVFWGVTESRHLVDIINQTDILEDIDGEEKLGQPMVHMRTNQSWGSLSLYLLPYFRERDYAGDEGRFRTQWLINNDNAQYQSSKEENHSDIAIRYSMFMNDWDVGLSYFKGTDREPILLADTTSQQLVPYYQQVNQFGADIQLTRDAWLWKLETIYKSSDIDNFWAGVYGLEYTFYSVASSDTDIGLLAEYLYDDRNERSPITQFQNDIFIGMRTTLNNTSDTTILIGGIFDADNNEQFYSIEAQHRLSNHFKLECNARIISHASSEQPLNSIKQDSYLEARLFYYF